MYDKKVEITEKKLTMSAYCPESQGATVFYDLEIEFWAEVDPESMTEMISMNSDTGFKYIIDKKEHPARWRSIFAEGSERPSSFVLNEEMM